MANPQAAPAPGASSWLHKTLLVVAIVPMVLVAAIISRYGVNVPYGDEWSLFSFIGKWYSHEASFADFFAVHNGHRILVPRVIYLALIHLTHGNLKAEMFFSLFLCVLTSVCIFLLLRHSVEGTRTKRLALWALINLFLFSPIQAENWLWGFQLQIFLANFCLLGAIVCIVSEVPVAFRVAGAAIFALAGTFSFGNGLLIWPVLFGVMICRRERPLVLRSWIILALLVVAVYFPGYPPREPTPSTTKWFDYLLYVAGFLGTPLARIPNSKPLVLPVIIGSLLVALFVWLAFRLLRSREQLSRAAPWLGVGTYAIASAVMACIARIHTGPIHSLDSRYTTVSLLLVVSVIVLVAMSLAEARKARPTSSAWTRTIGGVAVATLLLLYAINIPHERRYLRIHREFRDRGKAALQFSSVLDLDQACRSALLIRQDAAAFAGSLAVIDRFNLTDPARRKNLVLLDAEGRPKRSTEEYGVFENLKQSPDALAGTGWGYLPFEGRPAASVLLAYREGEEWRAFSMSNTTEPRTDVSERFKDQTYLNSGWNQRVDRTSLPPGRQEISAWALDADTGETYRLPGQFDLQ